MKSDSELRLGFAVMSTRAGEGAASFESEAEYGSEAAHLAEECAGGMQNAVFMPRRPGMELCHTRADKH